MSRFEEQRAIRRNEQMNNNNYQKQPYGGRQDQSNYGRNDYNRPHNNYGHQSTPYRPTQPSTSQ